MTPASATQNEAAPRPGFATSPMRSSLDRILLARPDKPRAVVLALCLVVAVFGLRLLNDDPGTAVQTLYVLPIALVAVAVSMAAGFAVAALCLATVFLWGAIADQWLDPLGYVTRGALFFIAATAGAVVARAGAAGAHSVMAWLPEGARSASVAREILGRFRGSLSDARLHDAQLLATELVANVTEHGKGVRIELRADLGRNRLRVEVIDHGGRLQPQAPQEDQVGGLGLQLVESLSDDWSAWHGGSSAWFQLPRE